MKTLILNGSPRKNGDTVSIISELTRHLDGEIKIVSAYRDGISACVDCRFCWKKEGCAIQDGMQQVYKAVEEYDNLVIASPIYFSQLTGPLLSLASRFQCYYAAKRFRDVTVARKRKNGVLILTGGGDGGAQPAESTANTLFSITNTGCIGTVTSLHTDTAPACRDESAMARACALALELNKLYADANN